MSTQNIIFKVETQEQLTALERLYKAYGYNWYADSNRYLGKELRLTVGADASPDSRGGKITAPYADDPRWTNKIAATVATISKPVTVAGYDTTLTNKGVKVGCTFVKWAEVDLIANARKAQGF